VAWEWDAWQKQVLETEGNITIRSGRQVGKSEVISAKARKFALDFPGTTTLIIAASQRQSSLLFEKVRAYLDQENDVYAEKPTLTKVVLKNGSKIYSLPAGRTGYFIRGFTIDMLIADEAAYIPETVWTAVVPMIAVSRKTRGMGWLVLLSTPFGRGGFFYDSFTDKDFRAFHVSSEDCCRIPLDFLAKEKERMSKVEYAQEYLGEFVEDWNQFFPTDLIKKCMTFAEWDLRSDARPGAAYYLGQDLARYGGDEVANVIVELKDRRLKAVKCLTRNRVSTITTIGETQVLDDAWNFRRIFTDSGGLGGPVLDQLQERLGKRRVVGLDNSSKAVSVNGEEKRNKILKEDLYSNVLMLMETGRLELINDLDLLKSMKSIIFEYTNDRNIKIFGNYSHLTEALVRACWCIKDKALDLYVY
jgi:hypothetical protein